MYPTRGQKTCDYGILVLTTEYESINQLRYYATLRGFPEETIKLLIRAMKLVASYEVGEQCQSSATACFCPKWYREVVAHD